MYKEKTSVIFSIICNCFPLSTSQSKTLQILIQQSLMKIKQVLKTSSFSYIFKSILSPKEKENS